jgi:hypothetical protein
VRVRLHAIQIRVLLVGKLTHNSNSPALVNQRVDVRWLPTGECLGSPAIHSPGPVMSLVQPLARLRRCTRGVRRRESLGAAPTVA